MTALQDVKDYLASIGVPAGRYSDAVLSQVIATEQGNQKKALRAAVMVPALPLLVHDPAGKANANLAANFTADTGQPMTAFVQPSGAAPLAYNGGVIVHTPFAGANSAGYTQANLGGRVRRMGAMVAWPLNALGVAAFVIPSAPWSNGVLPNAGFHLSVNGNGIWSLIRFTTGGSTTIANYTTHGRFSSSTWGSGYKPLDIALDPVNQQAIITWPDGSKATITSAYLSSETANYAIWELFETNGATDVPATFGKLWASNDLVIDPTVAAAPAAGPSLGPPSVVEALSRRVVVNMAKRGLPLGVIEQASDSGGPSFVPRFDPEVRRLEAPYRKLVTG
jgi:hypothetical protein